MHKRAVGGPALKGVSGSAQAHDNIDAAATGMNRRLTFTYWPTVTGKTGKPIAEPWDKWREALSKHERRPNKDGACLTLCAIPAGSQRKNKNVITIDGLCLDIDTGTEKQIFNAIAPFKAHEYVLHTTHSNLREYAHFKCKGGKYIKTKEGKFVEAPNGTHNRSEDENGKHYRQLKIRAVFPLARSISPAEHAKIWHVFSVKAKGLNDEKTKAVSHPFYLPAAPEGAKAFILHNQGAWLDPDVLLAAPTSGDSSSISRGAAASDESLPEVIVQAHTSKARGVLRRIAKGHELRDAATAVTQGEAFAEDGARHTTHVALTGYLAFKSYAAPFCNQAIENLFRASIAVMQEADADCEGLDAITQAYETAIANAVTAKKAEAQEHQRMAKGADSSDDDDFHVWTREDLEAIAEKQSVSDPRHICYIIAASGKGDNNYFVVRQDGSFDGPLTEKNATVKVFQNLAASPLELYDTTGDAHKRKPLIDLMIRHGAVANETIADLTIEVARFDSEYQTLYEACKPIQYHRLGGRGGAFNKDLDQFLRLFAGNEHVYRKLVAWLACLPDLNKMICALVITGDPGVGKTLFAHGCANLWADTPAPPDAIVGNFNEDLAQCPVVFADEILPKSMKWDSVTAKLRAEIGIMSRPLQRKFLSSITLRGALRFILATNNPMILKSEISTAADLKAIAQRFLYVEPNPKVEEFLKGFDFATKNRWRTYDFPRHALWLAENYKAVPEGRFWVMGDIDRMHRLLVTASVWNSRCAEWLVKGLSDGFRKTEHKTETRGYVRIKNGKLYVHTNAIMDGWEAYVNYPHDFPDPRHVATALRSIAVSSKQVSLRDEEGEGKRTRFFQIDAQHLVAWAEQQGTSDRESIETALGIGIRELPTVVPMKKDDDK